MKETTLVVVAEFNTATEAQISKSILQSAGIEAYIRNEYMAGFTAGGAIPVQVVVEEEDLEQARKLLRYH